MPETAHALCLFLGALAVPLGSEAVTLGWTHSVERQRWEEDWRGTDAGLVIEAARVRGSGAGMEPGEGAVLREGTWHWRPRVGAVAGVILRRSGATQDWDICVEGRCTPFSALLPPEADPVRLARCGG